MIRRVAIALAITVALHGSIACGVTTDEDKFCGRLRTEYRLDRLNSAITSRDQRRITESLASLRQLQDVAPAAIFDDFRLLVDAVSGAVRAITKAPGADGEQLPVDVGALNQQLAAIGPPAEHIADYARKNCGLTVNS